MNPRHLPLPLLAASIVGVIRPASAIQPDTQAIFGGSEAYMLPLPVEHLVVLLVVAVGCIGLLAFYDRVDEWAAATLLSIPREDNIVATARSATLQKQNSELRKMWVGSVIVMTTSLLRTVDHFSGCFVCVVLPMAAMTVSTSANSKWGWLNQGMQFVWLARRMALPHALLGPEAKLFFTVMSAHLWNEFSLEGFCAIFVLHAATNLTVLLTSPDQLSRSMMLSLAMLTLFVYRRRAPPSSGNKGAQQQDGLEIADDRSRSMQLISTALESKDRMSPASKQALLDLQELLSSATAFAAPFEFSAQTCSDSSSESKLSTGTGVGAVQASSTFQPPNLDILAATALQRVPSLQMRLQQPGPEICAAPDQFDHQYRSQGSSLDAWSLAQLQHKQQPQSYNSTVRFPPIARQQPMAVGPYSAGLPIPLGWPTPIAYSEQLVRLSFDGMAQVQVRTGAMLWTNQAFVRLCKLIGGGQLEAGLVSLHDRFCQDLSTEAQCLHSTFGAGDKGFRLWSTTTIVGPPGQEVMLWVLHHSMGGGDSSGTVQDSMHVQPSKAERSSPVQPQQTRQPAPGGSTESAGQREGASSPAPAKTDFPKAADYPDPKMKIVNGPDKCCGRGRRPTLMLWQKYGQKDMYYSSGVDSKPGVVLRLYYRCYTSDCPAKLKVDVVQSTGERVSVLATGTHTHAVVLAGNPTVPALEH